MCKKYMENIYKFIFEYLGVFDDLDFLCHYATENEWKDINKYDMYSKEYNELFKIVMNRVIKEETNKIQKLRIEAML